VGSDQLSFSNAFATIRARVNHPAKRISASVRTGLRNHSQRSIFDEEERGSRNIQRRMIRKTFRLRWRHRIWDRLSGTLSARDRMGCIGVQRGGFGLKEGGREF
jgi:hypothetical protein